MTLLYDTFQGVNGTHFAAHTPNVGGPWVDDTPGWQVQSNAGSATVDLCSSHVEIGKKVERLALTLNLHGCDANNYLTMRLGNDAADVFIALRIASAGGFTFVQTVAPDGDIYECDVSLPATLDTVADHTCLLSLGPDDVLAIVDGVIVCRGPRRIAKTVAPTRITVEQASLSAKPGPVIKSLLLY